MSLAVLARKTRTIKSKNRSSNTSSKKTNTPHIGYNNYLSRKNNSANRPSGLTCCTNNKVKVIVKTTDTKSASDKINKQKMHIISCNKEDIIASSSHIERVRSRVKTCINTLMDGPASVVGTLRWALLNWWPTTERPIKGIQFMKKGKYAKYGRIERWNTHKVTDFSDLISSVQKEMKRLGMIPILDPRDFNEYISNWDTSNVIDMSYMFSALSSDATKTHKFNQDISKWDVRNVKNMEGMFSSFENNPEDPGFEFNRDIRKWNVSKVENMKKMFFNAIKFSQNLRQWTSNGYGLKSDVNTENMFGDPTQGVSKLKIREKYSLLPTTPKTEKDIWVRYWSDPLYDDPRDGLTISDAVDLWFSDPDNFSSTGKYRDYGTIGDWNTNKVTDMSGLFSGRDMKNIDISDWDVGEVTDMSETFKNTKNLDISTLHEWQIGTGVPVTGMFDGAKGIPDQYSDVIQPDNGTPDVSKLFKKNKAIVNGDSNSVDKLGIHAAVDLWMKDPDVFNKLGKYGEYGSIDKWNTILVTDMSRLFKDNDNFNKNISEWDVSNVETMKSMFEGAKKFYVDLRKWDVGKVEKMSETFKWADMIYKKLYDNDNEPKPNIESDGTTNKDDWRKLKWPVAILKDGPKERVGSLRWALHEWSTDKSLFNTLGDYEDYGTIEEWNTSIITDMSGLFKDKDSFNEDISEWDVGEVKYMSSMFEGAADFNQDISGWNVSNAKDMSSMFEGASAFNKDISNWERAAADGAPVSTLVNVATMESMFKDAKAFNQNIGNWNTENVNNMSHMFDGAFVFNKSINSWTVSNVITMASMFKDAKAFNQNIGTWNTENVDNMSHMFDGALVFNKSINSWSVNNVKTTEYMFSNAQEFNNGSASLNTWQFNSNTNYEGMFKDARLFNQPINSWLNSAPNNIENDDKISFKDMFKDALVFNQNLTDWVVENVKDMSGMFYRAMSFNNGLRGPPEGLKEADPVGNIKGWIYEGYDENNKSNKIPISKWKWNVQNVETMSHMFFGAWAFNQTLSHWNYGNSLKDTSYMFYNAITFNNGYEYGVMNPPRHPDVGEANVLGGSTFATAEIITQDYKEEEISGNGSGYLFVGWFESVENASHMFNQAYSFNSNIFFAYLKLGVITNLDYMFANAISFETGFLEGYFADEPREATDEPTGFISAVLDLRIEVGTPEYEQRLRDGFPTYKNILLFSTGFTRNITNPSRAFKTSTVVFTPKEITDQTNLIDASAKTAGINITNLAENVTTSIVDTLISYATNIFTGLFR